MKSILLCLVLFTILIVTSCTPNAEQKKQTSTTPNFVVIFIDDMGYGDAGVYGATGYVTPNIDKLAAEGMRFTNFYSAQPVCSASRAGLIDGLLSQPDWHFRSTFP